MTNDVKITSSYSDVDGCEYWYALINGRNVVGRALGSRAEAEAFAREYCESTTVRGVGARCPDCGELLDMDYHDAGGNCVHQPL